MSDKNTFYTSVEHRGNNVLVRGYKNGMPFDEKIQYQPVLYFPATSETGFTTRDGSPLREKKYESIKDMKESLKTFSGVDNHKYYGTTNIIRQFIANQYRGEISWDQSISQVWFFDIETTVAEAIDLPEDQEFLIRDKDGAESTIDCRTRLTIRSEYEIYEDDKWKDLKSSKYRVKGFPKPDKALEEIQLISMYNYTQRKGYIFATQTISEDNPAILDGADFRSYKTEKEMLVGFIMFMRENRIDILIGWNSESFDVPYITNRVKRIHGDSVATLLSPWKIIQKRTIGDSEDETYDWFGICLIDYLEIYKKFNPGSQESFKLDYIAELEIGEKKVENPYESFYDFYTKDFDTFTYYNWIDSILLTKMEDKMQLVSLAMMTAFMSKVNIGDVVSAMRVWEAEIYNHFLSNNQFLQANAPKKPKRKIPGAYVHAPIPGKYIWTVSIDAEALYPSVIMQNNTSPETKFDKLNVSVEDFLAGNFPDIPEGYTIAGNGVLCSKAVEGFIPFLIRQKFDLRKTFKKQMLEFDTEAQLIRDKAKKVELSDIEKSRLELLEPLVRMLDIKQKVVKILANSFYGILLLEHFSQYDPDLGEAITLTGQVAIRSVLRILNDFLNKIFETSNIQYCIAADTDSVYFTLEKLVAAKCVGKSDAEIVNYLEQFVFKVVQPLINKELDQIMAKMGIDKSRMKFKLECIGPSAIFCAKKKYAFDILYSEGVRYAQPKMKVIGMEIVRSSTPSKIKTSLKESVKICLAKEEKDLQQYLKSVKEQFMTLDYKDISFPRGCNGLSVYGDRNTIYKGGTPMHVRGSLLYNHYLKEHDIESKYSAIGEGEKIKFVALKMPNPIHENVIAYVDKLPEEFGLHKYIDYGLQYEKAFLKPIELVLNSVKWSAEERINLEDFC